MYIIMYTLRASWKISYYMYVFMYVLNIVTLENKVFTYLLTYLLRCQLNYNHHSIHLIGLLICLGQRPCLYTAQRQLMITTKVVCFIMKINSLDKQCRPRSDYFRIRSLIYYSYIIVHICSR